MDKKPLIILTGPTAVGKTELSIRLAKALNGEIISADSMQVYKYMDIGTAKITPEQMQGVPHHLIDILNPDEPFNVVRFQQLARAAVESVYQKGKLPIIVGGTGFYIQALLKDIDFDENNNDNSYRLELEAAVRQQGPLYLHEKLMAVDPKSAGRIHPNNIKRVIRALEFYNQHNSCISEHNDEQILKEPPYQFAYFVLNMPREILYERINLRVDHMIEDGLVAEVLKLLKMGYVPELISMQGLGYKEFIPYFKGEISLDEAVETLKKETRHFCKRQLTWFKREPEVNWVNKCDYQTEALLQAAIIGQLEKKGLL